MFFEGHYSPFDLVSRYWPSTPIQDHVPWMKVKFRFLDFRVIAEPPDTQP